MEQPTDRRRAAERRGATPWRGVLPVVAAWLLASAAPAAAGNLVQVRVGNHPTYTRVVFELDAPTGYRIERRAAGASENTVVVTLQAASRVRNIQSKSQGVESVVVEPSDGQAVARIVTRDAGLPIKEMILTDPPRVVLDLMLPASAHTPAVAKATPKPAAVPTPAPSTPADEPPAAATAPVVVADNQPDAAELAPEPPIVEPPAEVRTPPEPAPRAATPAATTDEGEELVVAEPVEAPEDDAALAAAEAAAEAELAAAEAEAEAERAAAEAAAAVAEDAAGATAEADAEAAAEADSEAERMAAAVAAIEAQRAAEMEIEERLWAQEHPGEALPGAVAGSEPATGVTPALQEPPPVAPASGPGPSWIPHLDPITLGAVAGVALALLLVVVALLRRRRALPNDMDVTAFAAAELGDEGEVSSHGFGMDAPIADLGDPAEDFESGRAHETDDENKPIESAQAPVPGAGLFDDTPIEKDATMQNQDLSMTQGASDAATHLGAGSGLAGMAGDSKVASLVQELERRMTLMEQRLEEANEARERLERQVSAQSEELRVQRAAIARTQRALRGLNRSEEDQATEPALRDPADPAGRQ